MKISIASFSFHGLHGARMMDIFGYLESVKFRYRLNAADIWSGMIGTTEPDVIGKVREALDEKEMIVANYHVDEAHVWNPDREERAKNRLILEEHLRVAESLGAATVRIDFGGRASDMCEAQFDYLASRYSEYARRAADNGYRVGAETHFGPSLVLENMKRIYEAVDNPAYGILLHIGHWVDGSEEEGDRWAAAKAMHTHIDARVTATCLAEKIKLLKDAGYQGFWGVEHHSARNEYSEVAWQLVTLQRALRGLG